MLAYAFSPIDLIPDFIPVLGLLDDALLIPLGVWFVAQCTPHDVWARCRAEAELAVKEKRRFTSKLGATMVVLTYVALTLWCLRRLEII